MAKQITAAGCTDQPASVDQFQIKKYIDGLTTFISNCDTPMTLAIQGDWGTGKTSVMRMVQDRFQEDRAIQTIWFNTWQFSQFAMEDRLPLMLMSKLLRSVRGKEKTSAKDAAKKVFGVIGDIAVGYLSGGAANADALKEREEDLADFVDKIEVLKDNFQELIDEKAGDGRVVIFVDDLDRLQTGKAVELLEVLKIFLDCEKCVFVLAIDYGVVIRGVREKYGRDFKEDKARSFFDKIIQVPFKMPVADYDIAGYVRDNLERIGVTIRDERQLEIFTGLIERSIGNNPRSMKRLFNSFLLLRGIADDAVNSDNVETLFALLCMQSKFEKIYNYLIRNKSRVNEAMLAELTGRDSEEEESNPIFTELKMREDEIDSFIAFSGVFYDVIDKDGTGEISAGELRAFRAVLDFSSITSTDSKPETRTRTRGSTVVKNLEDWNMPHQSLEQKRHLCDVLRQTAPGVHVSLVNTNSGYAYACGRVFEGGPEFAGIEDMVQAYRLYVKAPQARYFTNTEAYPEIAALTAKLGDAINWRAASKKMLLITIRNGNTEVENTAKKLIRICYNLFLAEGTPSEIRKTKENEET